MTELFRALNPKGDEQVTVGATAASLTVPSGAKRAYIQVTAAPIYFVEDAGTPASTNGQEAEIGDVINYLDANYEVVLLKWRAIRQASTNAVLKVSYYD